MTVICDGCACAMNARWAVFNYWKCWMVMTAAVMSMHMTLAMIIYRGGHDHAYDHDGDAADGTGSGNGSGSGSTRDGELGTGP